MNESKPLLNAENITIIKGHSVLLRRFCLTLSAGEKIHLTGDNGSGKTTLLQALAGIHPYQNGHIEHAGKYLYLGHRAGVKGTLTPRENLRFAARLYHQMKKEGLENRLAAALSAVGLEKHADRQTRQLSAGQQRRSQLARLWLESPPLWLLDEPLTALDVATTQRLLQRVQNHCENGGAVIITSHQTIDLPQLKVVNLAGATNG